MSVNGQQDCARCSSMANCWPTHLSADHIILNLLICRLQRNIHRDRTAKLLLKRFAPRINKIARWLAPRIGVSFAEAVVDVQSVVIEKLLVSYEPGMRSPLFWLFDGCVRHYALQRVDRSVKERKRHVPLERLPSSTQAPAPRRLNGEAVLEDLERIIEDGRTLSVGEYRVLKFYTEFGRGHKLPNTDCMQRWLASRLGRHRNSVGRTYSLAFRRLLDAMGQRERHLGLTAREVQPDDGTDISRTAVELLDKQMSPTDVAWVLGISDTLVHQIRAETAT